MIDEPRHIYPVHQFFCSCTPANNGFKSLLKPVQFCELFRVLTPRLLHSFRNSLCALLTFCACPENWFYFALLATDTMSSLEHNLQSKTASLSLANLDLVSMLQTKKNLEEALSHQIEDRGKNVSRTRMRRFLMISGTRLASGPQLAS